MSDPEGVLVIDKPAGPTSHDVVAVARRALRIRRIGHTGTLDPGASGVLPLVLGRATRLAQFLTASDKEYVATIRFGVVTDTHDAAGRVVQASSAIPTREGVEAALERFRGAFHQTPPAYSAKKVGGERAYDRARRSEAVALPPVRVVVHMLELTAFAPPLATLRLVCTAGFYVRSLAHDLGQTIGTGAILERLVRTRSGAFTLANAVPLSDLAAGLVGVESRVIPVEELLPECPAVPLTPAGVRRVGHGQDVGPADLMERPPVGGPTFRLFSPDGRLLALAEPSPTPGFLHPSVVLASGRVSR